MKFIESGDANVGQMFEFGENFEKTTNSLSDNYFKIGEFSTVELANMKSLYDECLSRNATTMFKLTQAMRLHGYHDYGVLQNQMRSAAGSRTSKHSSKGSRSSRASSGGKSRNSCSSTTSMKASAAAKAAELRTLLKFHQVENEQKAELERTKLLRDLEVEEAKFAAIKRVECSDSNPVVSVSDSQLLLSSNANLIPPISSTAFISSSQLPASVNSSVNVINSMPVTTAV